MSRQPTRGQGDERTGPEVNGRIVIVVLLHTNGVRVFSLPACMLGLSPPLPPVVEDGTGTGAALLVLVLSCASSIMCLAVGTNSDRETPVRLSRPARLAVLPPSLRSSVVTLITGRDDLDLHVHASASRCVGPPFLTAVLCRRARAARPPFSLSIRDVLCCSQSVSVPLLTRPRYTSSARGLIDTEYMSVCSVAVPVQFLRLRLRRIVGVPPCSYHHLLTTLVQH